jgi:uncharacterized protein (DUF1810 family)
MPDPFDLQRFVDAQDHGGTYDRALGELRAGRKTSHWIWFVFPQVAGLGRSAISRTFAIASLAEAQAYVAHPVLGPRLRECVDAMLAHADADALAVLGDVDAMKFRSSMTLFARADPAEERFQRALEQFFGGIADVETERRL